MKIRKDLIGAVHLKGHTFYAGDTLPEGTTVGEHLVEVEKKEPAKAPVKQPSRARKKTNDK